VEATGGFLACARGRSARRISATRIKAYEKTSWRTLRRCCWRRWWWRRGLLGRRGGVLLVGDGRSLRDASTGQLQLQYRKHAQLTGLGLAAGAAGAAGAGGADLVPAPTPFLHLTSAFSNASLTFCFLRSSNESTLPPNTFSPTTFINVPSASAAAARTGSLESSRAFLKESKSGSRSAFGGGEVVVVRQRVYHLIVSALTEGFLSFDEVTTSSVMSAMVVCGRARKIQRTSC